MTEWMEQLNAAGEFAAIDREFAALLLRYAGNPDAEELYAAALLASRAIRAGHTCCDLTEIAGRPFPAPNSPLTLPTPDRWRARLLAPEFNRLCSGVPADFLPPTPLVLDRENRLYLQRYFLYEAVIAAEIIRRHTAPMPPELAAGELAGMRRNFRAGTDADGIDLQQLAVLAAASQRFSVITGGPGTGKTTVVAALLALEFKHRPDLSVALSAPTGKAQARLRRSLTEDGAKLDIDDGIRRKLAELEAGTLHSFLKPDLRNGGFRFNRDNPLPYDLVIIDECSMVPASLMAHFLQALRDETRVVLLGDKDQLASVEAGAVLAGLCDSAVFNRVPEAVAALYRSQFAQAPRLADDGRPLSGGVIELSYTHRFSSGNQIGKISRAIRELDANDPAALAREIMTLDVPEFRTRPISDGALHDELHRVLTGADGGPSLMCLRKLAAAGTEEALEETFAQLEALKILAAVRKGPRGVETLNAVAREILHLTADDAPGLPLLILVNDRRLNLYNGDTGVVWPEPEGGVRVRFPGNPRRYSLAELPPHEPVLAMTVHKSQGSGFGRTVIILPDQISPVLTRELVYTAITRARTEVELWCDEPVLAAALAAKTRRNSGLGERLRAFAALDVLPVLPRLHCSDH